MPSSSKCKAVPKPKKSKSAPKFKKSKPPLAEEQMEALKEKNRLAVEKWRKNEKIQEKKDQERLEWLKQTNPNMKAQIEKLRKFMEEAAQRRAAAAANMNNNQYRYQ